MHQMLDQTLMELNNLWKLVVWYNTPHPHPHPTHTHTHTLWGFWLFVLAPCLPWTPPVVPCLRWPTNSQMLFLLHQPAFSRTQPRSKAKGKKRLTFPLDEAYNAALFLQTIFLSLVFFMFLFWLIIWCHWLQIDSYICISGTFHSNLIMHKPKG